MRGRDGFGIFCYLSGTSHSGVPRLGSWFAQCYIYFLSFRQPSTRYISREYHWDATSFWYSELLGALSLFFKFRHGLHLTNVSRAPSSCSCYLCFPISKSFGKKSPNPSPNSQTNLLRTAPISQLLVHAVHSLRLARSHLDSRQGTLIQWI